MDDDLIKYGSYHPDFSEEIKYFEKGKIYSIQIESNQSCDQECIYCYASSEDKSLRELPSEDIINILNSAAQINVKAIDWLGGDPLLRKDWYELMKLAIKKGLKNNIWTSGIPLKEIDIAKKAVEVTKDGFISVHLDTLDEKIYKKLHPGNPTSKISAILKGVDNVQKLGKNPNHMINCITFTKPLTNDVEKTIRYFFEQKGMRTCLTQMCTEGLAKDKQDLIPNISEIQKACKVRDTINYPDSKLSMGTMDVNKYYCGGMICVTNEGDVTPCSVIRMGFGNIYESPLEKIIEENKNELLFLQLRAHEKMPGNCRSCENNSICWGCRAIAYSELKDIFGIDTKCYKQFNKDSRI
ncbi:MAG: radical SAM protein [Thermoplasmatales archaeon]|nr:MAG: radical SAM protein [Thermoplasmatales archaeon]